MRVIAGSFRGRPIKPVPYKGTRPTTDRVREAWASTLENLLPTGIDGIVACDAFAGSGALGIELLSRGAGRVVFYEQNRKAFAILRGNLASLGVLDEGMGQEHTTRALTLQGDVLSSGAIRFLAQNGPYHVLILDPPYVMPPATVAGFLAGLAAAQALAPKCIVSYEQSSLTPLADDDIANWLKDIPCPSESSFILETRKKYGTIALEFFRYCINTQ